MQIQKSEKHNWMREGVERPPHADDKRRDVEIEDFYRERYGNPKVDFKDLSPKQRAIMGEILDNERDLDNYRSLDRKKKPTKSKSKRKSKKKRCGCK